MPVGHNVGKYSVVTSLRQSCWINTECRALAPKSFWLIHPRGHGGKEKMEPQEMHTKLRSTVTWLASTSANCCVLSVHSLNPLIYLHFLLFMANIPLIAIFWGQLVTAHLWREKKFSCEICPEKCALYFLSTSNADSSSMNMSPETGGALLVGPPAPDCSGQDLGNWVVWKVQH